MTLDTITHDDVIQEEPEELSEEEYYPEDNTSEDKIIIPSPKVSIDENDIPIIVRNRASFEERILEASPDASVPLELTPCDICGRKFNPQALERHTKVTFAHTNLLQKSLSFQTKPLKAAPLSHLASPYAYN